jgi:hypothetical protein
MATKQKHIRQSVTLPMPVANRVRTIAEKERTSANKLLVELIESGLETKEAEKKRFFELADALETSANPAERRRIKKELARLTFGE